MNRININSFPELSYATAEAINTLCTNLTFTGDQFRKVMLTSCHASEGKSFLTMNIARTFSRLGKKVAVVDADLRRSMMIGHFDIQFADEDHRIGLSHYLAGMAEENDVIYETNLENVIFVPVGRDVSNSLPLLNSPRFPHLLDTLRDMVDYVIVDAPPVGSIIDAAQIAKSCDGVLLVVNYNEVRRRELVESADQLRKTGCPILGTVLNMVAFDSFVGRKYYYKSYYSKYYYYYKKDGSESGHKHRSLLGRLFSGKKKH